MLRMAAPVRHCENLQGCSPKTTANCAFLKRKLMPGESGEDFRVERGALLYLVRSP